MYQLHDIHTFQEIDPKLTRTNWLSISWKRDLQAIAEKIGLYNNIIGTDILPTAINTAVTSIGALPHLEHPSDEVRSRTSLVTTRGQDILPAHRQTHFAQHSYNEKVAYTPAPLFPHDSHITPRRGEAVHTSSHLGGT